MKDIKKIISEIRDWLYRGINGYSIRDRSMDRIYRHYTGESSSLIYISPKWWGKIIAFFIKMNPLKKAGTFLIMIVMMIVVSLKDVINERLKSEISHLFEETIGPTLGSVDISHR